MSFASLILGRGRQRRGGVMSFASLILGIATGALIGLFLLALLKAA
jgi:hypothetical protein